MRARVLFLGLLREFSLLDNLLTVVYGLWLLLSFVAIDTFYLFMCLYCVCLFIYIVKSFVVFRCYMLF